MGNEGVGAREEGDSRERGRKCARKRKGEGFRETERRACEGWRSASEEK